MEAHILDFPDASPEGTGALMQIVMEGCIMLDRTAFIAIGLGLALVFALLLYGALQRHEPYMADNHPDGMQSLLAASVAVAGYA
ncbi:hypothetical protein B5P45_04450 [Phyllobacterium zundukense]|uniref:Uncharacterized protein n=2 Tax=Phyllobacterium zundukense TaxID=1867719 RepID=A0A2N9W232_9HYPH|nr:hypothetical protein BLM14_05980 [Phyllobacterium zundukense]PIO45800.1 hypothetical protein B5P45_04450 [Phyllobacterium zundukense]